MGHDRDPDTEKNSYRFYELVAPIFTEYIDCRREAVLAKIRAGETVPCPQQLASRIPSAGRVLDCACGRGFWPILLTKLGYKVVGSDLNPEMLTAARKGAVSLGLDLPFVQSSWADLPRHFSDEFDCVLCFESLSFATSDDDAVAALQGMCAVLKQGGLCIVTCPKNWPLPNGHRFFPNPPYAKSQAETETIAFEVWREEPSFVKLELLYLTGREGEWDLRVASTLMRKLSGDVLQDLMYRAGFSQVDVAESRDAHAAGPDPVIGWTATGRK